MTVAPHVAIIDHGNNNNSRREAGTAPDSTGTHLSAAAGMGTGVRDAQLAAAANGHSNRCGSARRPFGHFRPGR
jgi:hypothetical protein